MVGRIPEEEEEDGQGRATETEKAAANHSNKLTFGSEVPLLVGYCGPTPSLQTWQVGFERQISHPRRRLRSLLSWIVTPALTRFTRPYFQA